jgi:hypothetical protein
LMSFFAESQSMPWLQWMKTDGLRSGDDVVVSLLVMSSPGFYLPMWKVPCQWFYHLDREWSFLLVEERYDVGKGKKGSRNVFVALGRRAESSVIQFFEHT